VYLLLHSSLRYLFDLYFRRKLLIGEVKLDIKMKKNKNAPQTSRCHAPPIQFFAEIDRFIIKFWVKQTEVNMNDRSLWFKLKEELTEKRLVRTKIPVFCICVYLKLIICTNK